MRTCYHHHIRGRAVAAAALAAALLPATACLQNARAQSPATTSASSSSATTCTSPQKTTETVTVGFDSGTQAVTVDPMVVEVPFCTVARITWVPADGAAYGVSKVQGCAAWGMTHASARSGRVTRVDANTTQARRKYWYYQVFVTGSQGKKKGSSQPCNASDPPVIHNG